MQTFKTEIFDIIAHLVFYLLLHALIGCFILFLLLRYDFNFLLDYESFVLGVVVTFLLYFSINFLIDFMFKRVPDYSSKFTKLKKILGGVTNE